MVLRMMTRRANPTPTPRPRSTPRRAVAINTTSHTSWHVVREGGREREGEGGEERERGEQKERRGGRRGR